MRYYLVLLGLTLFSVAAHAADPNTDRLIAEGLRPSPIEANLRRLTDEIGGRLPGTPAFKQAVDWGIAAFKEAGADSVHTEEFTIPHSWAEGETTMSASLYSGAAFPVRAVSLAWAPALAPAKHAPMVDVGEGTEEDFKKAGDIAGKILLVHTEVLKTWADLFGEYDQAPNVITQAVKGKAKAVAFMASREHDILYRHTNTVAGEVDRLPMVLVAREDGQRLARLLASGHPVWADLSIPNKIGGPFKTWNVVAEIRGSEKPDEYVVLGAHLDSFELGTGALDNGCNAALVIDVLRAIKASGLQPRRSIRFILFSGEEQGMMGSRAYVADHKADLDKIAGVIAIDSGTGKITGYSVGGRKDVAASVQPLLAPLAQFGAHQVLMNAETGTDHFDFMLQGVPTFMVEQVEANYMENYHAVSDTFDKVDFAQLKKNAAEEAVLVWELANLTGRVGPRLHRAEIEQTLRETHLDQEMKSMEMWDDWASGKRGRTD